MGPMWTCKRLVLVSLMLLLSNTVAADTFETKAFRSHKLSVDKGRITCVKQAAAWLGLNQTGVNASGVQIQGWTDPANDDTLGTHKVMIDVIRGLGALNVISEVR